METTTGFTVTEYLPHPFAEVGEACARCSREGLVRATRQAIHELPFESAILAGSPAGPRAELGERRVTPWGLVEFPVQWKSANGSVVIDATLRVLPVDGGQDQPVTELLLHGVFCSDAACDLRPVAWVRKVVESLGQLVAASMAERALTG